MSIIEEHALNDKPIDVPRLTRLIEQRRRQERVSTPITVAELIEQAEFNILGTRYLAFDRKQALKAVFDSLYSDLSTRSFAPYSSETPKADLLNSLARQIQDGKSTEALETLKRLQEAHFRDLQEARSGRRAPRLSDALKELSKDPWPLVVVLVGYLAVGYWIIRRRPELISVLRRAFAPRMDPSLARERITRYLEAGMPDELIVEHLSDQGAPRSWVTDELWRIRSRETKHSETTSGET